MHELLSEVDWAPREKRLGGGFFYSSTSYFIGIFRQVK